VDNTILDMEQKSIKVRKQTYQALSDSKAIGQSFDGKIRELLREKEKIEPEEVEA